MTRREKFLDLIKDEMFFQEEITLREITDELFIEWMTHGGFHLGAAFHYFTLFFGYTGKCNDALIKWLNERVEDNNND